VTPESRREQLISQEVGQELVVYDQQTHTAHRLNRTAALVWRLADGERSVSDISKILHDTADVPEDEELVRMALSELDKSGLLLRGLPTLDERITRRRLLSMSAALIPVVASIGVPSPASAQSGVLAPNPTSVTPAKGPASGGTSVTIGGTRLTGVTKVAFGGVDATTFTVVSDTSITATTPAGTAGARNVAVTGPGGTTTITNGFTYATITSVSPTTGPTGGGTSVTITGVGFTGATQVSFGGVNATTFTVVNDTTITATTPAGTAGAKNVVVTLLGGATVSLANGFTYFVPFTQTFTYTGAPASLTVPAGVTSLVVVAFGAQGSFPLVGDAAEYGKGGRIQTTIPVTPGETLDIIVGGQGGVLVAPAFGGGGPSMSGGGGGGLSGIFRTGVPVVIAGGGGGGSSFSSGSNTTHTQGVRDGNGEITVTQNA
jgi:hypothetical protein